MSKALESTAETTKPQRGERSRSPKATPVKLTTKFCEAARPGRDAEGGAVEVSYQDAVTPGLALRVMRSGQRSWTYRYTTTRGAKAKQVRAALGLFPVVTLSDARGKAKALADAVKGGSDPAYEARQLRHSVTFKALAERMLKEHPTLADTTRVNYAYVLARHVYPTLADVPAAAVKPQDVRAILNAVQASGADRKVKRENREAADYVKTAIGSVFKFARKTNAFGDTVVVNPALGLGRRSDATPRLNPLPDETIKAVWHAIEEAKARPPSKDQPRDAKGFGAPLSLAVGDILRLCILTGSRRAEVAEARLSEFDLATGLWTLPGDTKVDGRVVLGRTKNGNAKSVPLPVQALDIVNAAVVRAGNSAFLFPSPSPALDVGRGDNEDRPVARLSATRAFSRIVSAKKLPGRPHLHDARAACRTWLRDREYSREVRDAILGHLGEGIGAKRYEAPSRRFIDNQVKPALQAWADHVAAITR